MLQPNFVSFLYRKLSFLPLFLFSYHTKQPARHRIGERMPLTPVCHLRRSTTHHVVSDVHSVYEQLTNAASRRGFSLMAESRSIAGVNILTVFKDQIARAHHLGCVKGW